MSDPSFASVKLLLHCNGTDASTTFTDSSSAAQTVAARGNAQIDTGQSKWGGASAQFDGTEDALTIASPSGLTLSGDFTVELWARRTGGEWSPTLVKLHTSSTWFGGWALAWNQIGDDDGTQFETWSSPSDGSWHHIAWTRSGSTHRVFVDGTQVATFTDSSTISTVRVSIGGTFQPYDGVDYFADTVENSITGHLDDVRITAGVARYTSSFSAPSAEFEEGGDPPSSIVAADSPLGAAEVLAGHLFAITTAESPLSTAAQVLGSQSFGLVEVAGPLGPEVFILHEDLEGFIVPGPELYVADLTTPTGFFRVPISSWQATLQTGAQCYAQCVIPAADKVADALEVATDFAIFRRFELLDGQVADYHMAGAPASTIQLDQGPTNYTATVSGYTDAIPEDASPPAHLDRTLEGVRSISTSSAGVRVRCVADYSLRPARRAHLGSTDFVVAYQNFYCPGTDSYMDVGERI